jgi:hypothetical protein
MASATNITLNGDFEINNGTDAVNVTNAMFNTIVSNAIAFGTAQEIDIVKSSNFGLAPVSGNWKVGIHTRIDGLFDAFSLALTSPLVVGNSYSLQFFAAKLDPCLAVDGCPAGNISVGLSSTATALGTELYTGTPSNGNSWTQFNFNFVASTTGSFLTFTNTNLGGFSFIDNVSLSDSPTGVPEPSTTLLIGGALAVLAPLCKRIRR